ncbi:MAG: uroporphyrinogen decarboxylase family protein [Promethearchaeota archaeon]
MDNKNDKNDVDDTLQDLNFGEERGSELFNHKDLILKTFKHEKLDYICWQPRIMLYYNSNYVGQRDPKSIRVNKASALKIDLESRHKFVPKGWLGKTPMDLHKELNASIRYTAETLGISYFYEELKEGRKIKIKSRVQSDGSTIRKIETPLGTLTERIKDGYKIEKIIKKPEDIKIAKYYISAYNLKYNEIMYEAALEELENLGVPQTYYFRSPYQACVLDYLGFEKTIIWLKRKPSLMEDFLIFLDEIDREKYKTILKSDLKILNFGENIDDFLTPPPIFERFHIPYYKERVKWVHDAGKFCHIHIDGHFKDLLPYLADLPFDGLEALTPEPQGDVTLEELRDNIGNKILLDGIPATLFMPQFPLKRLVETTKKILEYFSPNLILGVSDELPGNADGRRLKIITKLVEEFVP